MNEIEMDFDLDCLLKIRRVIFRKRAKEQFSLVNTQKQSTNNEPSSSWYMSYANGLVQKQLIYGKQQHQPMLIKRLFQIHNASYTIK